MSTPTVNIHHAKTHLSQLLEQVQQGQAVVIAKAGHPVARLAPLRLQRPRPRQGRLSPMPVTCQRLLVASSSAASTSVEGCAAALQARLAPAAPHSPCWLQRAMPLAVSL